MASRMGAVAQNLLLALALAFAGVLVSLQLHGIAWADPAQAEEGQEQEEPALSGVILPDHVDADEVKDGSKNRINPQQQPDSSFIYDVSIADLANADSYMNGQTVQFEGEAVGDIINAEGEPDHCWVVVASLDRGMSGNVSVYMTKIKSAAIDTLGRYGTTGTTLQVRGKFNLVCSEHDGISDVHADFVGAVDQGSSDPDKIELQGMLPGLVMIMIGCLLFLLMRFLRERSM